MSITLRYSAVDGTRLDPRTFGGIGEAIDYAKEWVGETPEIGTNYAVSWDGIGKITVVVGCKIAELFSALAD